MLLTRSADLRQAQLTSTIEDIRIWKDLDGADPTGDLAALLGELGLAGKRIGYYSEIRFYKVAEPAARIAGVETGQYQFGDRVPYDLAMKVKDKPEVVVTSISPFTWPIIYFNYHPDPDGKPSLFSNLKMRQAVQALLDMNEIMKAAGTGPGR